MKKISTCRSCQRGDLKPFFDLGAQPFANSLLSSPNESEQSYPLSLSFCGNCSLVQLNHTADPKELFSHYIWVTGTSKTANEFAATFCRELIKRAGSEKDGYVLEIASNDGTFLKPFQYGGYEVLGVDPAENIVDIAERAGVPTRAVFWGTGAARDLVREKGRAKMIFARNVIAHVAGTRDFVFGISEALRDDGVVAIETHYAKRILEDLQYDSIYHEHLCYFTLESLEKLLNTAGLFVFDVSAGPISGGALIVYAKKHKEKEGPEVTRFRRDEEQGRTNECASWELFRERVFAHKKKLLDILGEAKEKGSVIGWGASARSSTMLNFCGIDSSIVASIIDLNPLKHGKFTAGTHIPVVTPENALKKTPSMVFITGWNFRDEIIEMLRNKFDYNGPCLVPLPGEPEIIQKN